MQLVWPGGWFGRGAGLAGKVFFFFLCGHVAPPAAEMPWGLAGKLVWPGNLFFVTLGKTFINILVVKQITYNAKVSDNKIL